MREILFRGKDETGILNHSWQLGALDNTDENFPKIIRLDRWGNKMIINVSPETVGEFTGHLIEEKQVFEGDIVRCRHRWRYGSSIHNDTIEEFLAQKIRGAYGKYVEDGYWGKNCYYYRNYVVEHDRRNGCWRLKNGSVVHCIGKSTLFNRNAELIGNIHDNPELLKESEGTE